MAALLHLGNVSFVQQGQSAAVARASLDSLQMAAKLLGVPTNSLQSALVTQTVPARGDVVQRELDLKGALQSRDALAKVRRARIM